MTTTAFPVRQDADGNGCTDVALRSIVAALYPNKGVISGLSVKGGNTLSYTVASGVAVCSKGSADGNTLAYYEGGSVDTTANTSSNPRIDVVWITAHDITQGDTDNFVTIGVTQGTAAAAPTEPSIPSYATKLRAMKLPGGSSTTSSATAYGSQPVVLPYNSNQGILASVRNGTSGDINPGKTDTVYVSGSFYLSQKRAVLISVSNTVAVNGKGSIGGDFGSFYSKLFLDNSCKDIREVIIPNQRQTSNFYQLTLELGAGNHTFQLKYSTATETNKLHLYGSGVVGQQVQVTDLGPVD